MLTHSPTLFILVIINVINFVGVSFFCKFATHLYKSNKYEKNLHIIITIND